MSFYHIWRNGFRAKLVFESLSIKLFLLVSVHLWTTIHLNFFYGSCLYICFIIIKIYQWVLKLLLCVKLSEAYTSCFCRSSKSLGFFFSFNLCIKILLLIFISFNKYYVSHIIRSLNLYLIFFFFQLILRWPWWGWFFGATWRKA